MSGVAGNRDLLFALGGDALRSVDGLQTYYSVQHRHPDGQRWLDLAHFRSHAEAKDAIRSVVAAGHATTDELRVRKVTRTAG
jgi:hypothetical protein